MKKNIIWDHNRGMMYQRASMVLNDPEAAKYVWGVGFHWYINDNFESVKRVDEDFPGKHLLFTEGTNFPYSIDNIHKWKWAENYGRSMVHDLNNGAVGWTDWNILLNQHGGPNHVENFCFAPIHGDTETAQLTYMNSYYYIGHSRSSFVPVRSALSVLLIVTSFRPPLSSTGTEAWRSSF